MSNYEIFLICIFLIYVFINRLKSFNLGIEIKTEFLDKKPELKTIELTKNN